MAALLALLSSVLWGTADFGGGVSSRRLPVLAVIGWSQATALVAVGLAAAVLTPLGAGPALVGAPSGLGWLAWSLVAGAFGMGGLLCFYRALAIGTMGVVSPVAGLGVAVPVLAGLAAGERPSGVQLVGMVVALAGALAASGPELSGAARGRAVGLAALSGAFFGVALLAMARGAASSPLFTLLGMRCTSVAVVSVVAVVGRTVGGVRPRDLPLLAGVGLADAGANLLFAVATTLGLVSVVAVLGTLYPVATVLLARFVLHERLVRIQQLGVAVALAGVVMLGAG